MYQITSLSKGMLEAGLSYYISVVLLAELVCVLHDPLVVHLEPILGEA